MHQNTTPWEGFLTGIEDMGKNRGMAQGRDTLLRLRQNLQLLLVLWSLGEGRDTGPDHRPSSPPVIAQTFLCELLGLAAWYPRFTGVNVNTQELRGRC